jgi:hypothetical protein
MHRKTLVTAACGAVAVLALGLTGPAQARTLDRADSNGSSSARAQARLSCPGGVVGVTDDRHVASYTIKNDKVQDTRVSDRALGYDVDAIGYFDSSSTRRKSLLKLDAVAANGVPRKLTVTFPSNSDAVKLSSSAYDQTGFHPRLFADGFGYYAYTVNGSGVLQRWTLTKYANGDVRFAHKVKVGGGYGSLTSLQASTTFKKRKTVREYLYATTSSGALKQIAVPLRKPGRESVKRLRRSGYDGVTELVWTVCNHDFTHTSLIAIDPVADTATWTTIKRSSTRPRATLHGQMRGQADWNFTAAY